MKIAGNSYLNAILKCMDLNNVANLITSDLSNYNEFGLYGFKCFVVVIF